MPAYHSLVSDIQHNGCLDIGIKIDSSDIEYPIWVLLDAPRSGARIEHLDVQGSSAGYHPQNFHPCAIICSYCGDSSLPGLPLATIHQGKYFLYLQAPPG
jgi:hypothetical protein